MFNVPIHEERYDVVNGRLVNKKDNTHNPDARPACYRCLDKYAGDTVFCRRKGLEVSNIADQFPEAIMPAGDYENVEVTQ